MIIKSYNTKKIKNVENYFKSLRNNICANFENIEKNQVTGTNINQNPGKFRRKTWKRKADKGYASGGGGVISIMNGRIFEKVGVNISTVIGTFSEEMKNAIPGALNQPHFFATGISVVAHMHSPLIPAAHMNLRYIHTDKGWYGGGIDLTPMYGKSIDIKKQFHKTLKIMCDRHNSEYYKKFKKWCDDYFYLPHRNEPRGMGGIFFDNMDQNLDNNFEFIQDVGNTFLESFSKIVNQNSNRQWTNKQKKIQLIKRGRYVEFNLLYDRGTAFGLKTGGNVDAIFMSLPPSVSWP